MSKVVIFGAGKTAEIVFSYLMHDSDHQVVAFTCDDSHIDKNVHLGLPLIAFKNIQASYPPGDFKMFVAVGYQDMNLFRAARCQAAREKGYALISYVSSGCHGGNWLEIGDNCLIMDNVSIQPGARIGNNVALWSGALVGHHSTIGDHCWLASEATVGGNTEIGPYCFIGLNATIGHQITIGGKSLIGAGCRITKNAPAGSVFAEKDTDRHRLDSEQFLKITKMA